MTVDLPNFDPVNGSLTELRLMENNFEGKELDFNLPELDHLDLSKSSITIWPDVYGCPKLRSLILISNKIPSLPASPMLPPDNALTHLYLRHNQIGDTFQGIFVENLDDLIHIDLGDCGMTAFPNVSHFIDTLRTLMLSYNQLSRIDPKALLGVDNFTSPEIPSNGYPKLHLLELAANPFVDIPLNLFQIFPKVRDLKLFETHITQVPDFSPLKDSLRIIRIFKITRDHSKVSITRQVFEIWHIYILWFCLTMSYRPFPFLLRTFLRIFRL